MNELYEIYTDGGCFPNPGKGSWAVVVVRNGLKIDEKFGVEENTTNNRMEYTAIINALKIAKIMKVPLVIRSDSELLVKTYNELMFNWARLGWKRPGKNKEIKNLDLVQELFNLKREMHSGVVVKWIRGHNGNQWNEHCDEICSGLINQNKNKSSIDKSIKDKTRDLEKMIYYCDRLNSFVATNLENMDQAHNLFQSINSLKDFFLNETEILKSAIDEKDNFYTHITTHLYTGISVTET